MKLAPWHQLETSQQVDWNRFFPNLWLIIIPRKIQERILVGGIPTPLKNIRQLGSLFPIYGNKNHVPNHQPE